MLATTRRRRRRRAAVKALVARVRRDGRCALCGLSDPDLLSFHHLDARTKAFGIGRCRCRSPRAVAAELAKCCLLCLHCHKLVEVGRLDASNLVPLDLPGAALMVAP
jgi:hypothetical protein